MAKKTRSAAETVRRRIKRAGGNHTWTLADFGSLGEQAVAAELSRLARKGELRRVRKGVYFRPKETVIGSTAADPEAITDALLRKRGVDAVHGGWGEYHRLGLTTQVPNVITRAADRRVRLGKVKGIPVQIFRRPLHEQEGITGVERTVLDALREVDQVPAVSAEHVLDRLKSYFASDRLDFHRLAGFATVEPARVRALLGAIGEDLAAEHEGSVDNGDIMKLRQSLNPLSSYKIEHLGSALQHAAAWNITAA